MRAAESKGFAPNRTPLIVTDCAETRETVGLLSRSAASALLHLPIVLLFIGYRSSDTETTLADGVAAKGKADLDFSAVGGLKDKLHVVAVVKLTSEAAPELLKDESFRLTKEKLAVGLTGKMQVAYPKTSRARIVAPQ